MADQSENKKPLKRNMSFKNDIAVLVGLFL